MNDLTRVDDVPEKSVPLLATIVNLGNAARAFCMSDVYGAKSRGITTTSALS
jgi:hypothetical protein